MTNVDLSQLVVDRATDRDQSRPTICARRQWLTRYVIPAAVCLGFLSLIGWTSRDIVLPPQPVRTIPILATQAEVQRGGTPLFQAAGWIEPRPTPVRVAALATGVIAELLVVEDQPVKAGQPIAELIKDDARLVHEAALADQQLRQAELEQAQAALTAAKTKLEQPVHLEADLGKAEAELARVHTMLQNLPYQTKRAEAQLRFADEDLRGKQAAKRSVARRQVDEARSEFDSAQALVAELRSRDTSLRKQAAALVQRRDALRTQLQLLADEIKAKDEAAAKVKAATARLEQARVAVAEAKLQLDRMTVRSPIEGRVYQLIGHPGADTAGVMTAMQGHDARTVVTLYRPEMLQVRVDVRFEDIPKVGLNQPVVIDNPAIREPIRGHVLYVSSEADIQKNTLQVKVGIDSPPEVFKPEMLVDVTFLAPSREQLDEHDHTPGVLTRLYVPQAFVHQDDNGPFVWLADQSAGRARRTPIEIGVAGSSGMIEVTGGLNRASRLITTGTENLNDNARIRVIGEDVSSYLANSRTGQGSTPRRLPSRLPSGGQ